MLDKTFAFLEAMAQIESEQNYELWRAALKEVEALRTLPERILLAGSARFKQAFEDEAYRLALEGVIVLGKHVFKPGADWPLDDRHRDLIHVVQFRMCDMASRLHVLNVDSYIGQDTYNLIRYALRTGRVVTFMEEKVRLLAGGEKVTAHHFLQGTQRNLAFEEAALGS